MSVGSRIKELREIKKISRNELAEMLNVTVGAISNYENGVSSPKEPILFKIIEALGCDANYLFQDSIKMSSLNNDVSLSEYEIIKKYRSLDKHGKELVTTILDKESERSLRERELSKHQIPLWELVDDKKLQEDIKSLIPTAAHERTDIEVTDEMKKHDDDIMDDEDF